MRGPSPLTSPYNYLSIPMEKHINRRPTLFLIIPIVHQDSTLNMTSALLVIDMQMYFKPMVGKSLPHTIRLIRHFKSRSLPVFFTQHGHPPEDFKPNTRNQLVRKWGVNGSLHLHTPDWELIPEIEAEIDENTPIVAKNTYDAFIGTRLEEMLVEKGVERVVISGTMTDCCCDTTGRAAFNRGFETWMVGDACGSVDKEQHERGLAVHGFAFGEVMKTDEVIRRLK